MEEGPSSVILFSHDINSGNDLKKQRTCISMPPSKRC